MTQDERQKLEELVKWGKENPGRGWTLAEKIRLFLETTATEKKNDEVRQ